jgi:D-glucuronyl C5-epimerase C-terminus
VFRRTFAVAAVVAILAPASAAAGPGADAYAIHVGLTRAVAAERLDRADVDRYRLIVRRCRAILTLLPEPRWSHLAAVLHTVARQAGRFNRPRAAALFGMLELNSDYLSVRSMPPHGTDVRGGDGIVYRATWTQGFQFHPLANFGALNSDITHRNDGRAEKHAEALAARMVRRRLKGVWEYYFPFGGGWPPWTSGMAQAAAAHALARAGTRYDRPFFLRVAGRAYRSIPEGFAMQLSAGPWVRLYRFNRLVVLNAQLQSVVSLGVYAALSGDTAAAGYSERMKRAADTMFPRFETRYWSRYSLGQESPLRYHVYVISLLRKLAARTGEAAWTRRADRFHRYTVEPPVFGLGRPRPTLYPVPAEGYRDVARIRFWLSKISEVTLTIAGEQRVYQLSGGWHTVKWWPGGRAPGTYRPTVRAVDLAGNRGSAALQPIVIKRDREPPVMRASVSGRTLTWRAVDEGTPSLRLRVLIDRLDVHRVIRLGIYPLSGSLRLPLPRGYWNATLVAIDSSGHRTWVPLGVVPKL